MVYIPLQVGADRDRDRAGGPRHPAVAGTLAVILVSLLTASVSLMFDAGWSEPLYVWLLLAAAILASGKWIAAARGRVKQEALSAVPQPQRGAEARGVRRHHRHVPANKSTAIYTQEGRRIAARIANISVAAVAIEAKLSDRDYMTALRVGSREVAPIRRTPTGAVFGFRTILEPQPFDDRFVL